MKKNNPNTPIMIREAAGTQPRVYARYGEIPSYHHSFQLELPRRIPLLETETTTGMLTEIAYRIRKGEERVAGWIIGKGDRG